MKKTTMRTIAAIVCAIALAAATALAAPDWKTGYKDDAATGDDVIAFWNFDAGDGVGDASRHDHTIALRDQTRIEAKGKFGACLECFPSGQGMTDKAQGAVVKKEDSLNPKGPFTVDMWISLRDDAMQRNMMMLIDNKYYFYNKDIGPKANSGFCLFLQKRTDKWQLVAFLGYGQDSVRYHTEPQALETNIWYHIAFAYDGKGKGTWYLNGEKVAEKTEEGREAIAEAKYNLTIGERVGSTYCGFAGYIDELRFSNVERTFEP